MKYLTILIAVLFLTNCAIPLNSNMKPSLKREKVPSEIERKRQEDALIYTLLMLSGAATLGASGAAAISNSRPEDEVQRAVGIMLIGGAAILFALSVKGY